MARPSSKPLPLSRLAFQWAVDQGFALAAQDVKVPRLGCRIDVAACRPEPVRKLRGRPVFKPGAIAVFECKRSRPEFLKDARSEDSIRERLQILQVQRLEYEESMRRNFPTLREGETLFPEFDAYCYRDAGWAPYNELIAEMQELNTHLHSRTKFARLMRLKAANVLYVVAEPGVAQPQELPVGWGLLERHDGALQMISRAVWQDALEVQRWNVMVRIGVSASAAVGKSFGK